MAKVDKFRHQIESGDTITLFTRGSHKQKVGVNWVFYAMDYFATGEGRTLMFLIDKTDDERQAMQDFFNFCGPYYSVCVEKLTQENFLSRYECFLPSHVKVMLKQPEGLNSMRFLQELHFNFA